MGQPKVVDAGQPRHISYLCMTRITFLARNLVAHLHVHGHISHKISQTGNVQAPLKLYINILLILSLHVMCGHTQVLHTRLHITPLKIMVQTRLCCNLPMCMHFQGDMMPLAMLPSQKDASIRNLLQKVSSNSPPNKHPISGTKTKNCTLEIQRWSAYRCLSWLQELGLEQNGSHRRQVRPSTCGPLGSATGASGNSACKADTTAYR